MLRLPGKVITGGEEWEIFIDSLEEDTVTE